MKNLAVLCLVCLLAACNSACEFPAAVTEAIAKNFAESTVKEAAVEAAEDGSKTYQVVLTDKEGAESTVFFNEKGEILK